MTAIIDVGIRDDAGTLLAVGAHRWVAQPEAADLDVLDEARPAVLDIGCGPGRHVAELAARGIPVLGIDITGPALDVARRRGAPVLQRSVFERVPGAGRWRCALLLDGNIGIGGDPTALLHRVGALLAPDGIALVELAAAGSGHRARRVRLEIDGEAGPPFRWSHLALDELDLVVAPAGFVVARRWCSHGRWFARVERDARP